MPNQNAAGNTGAANTTPNDGAPAANAAQAQQAEGSTAQQKTFTQEEVNALVGKVRQDERAKYAGGSSPRVRGTLALHDLALALSGIIPACAGDTGRPARRCTPWRDHPRVCGEHYATNGVPYCAMGSSPRMRGTPVGLVDEVMPAGIIPACAGSTTRRPRQVRAPWDHPRVCGEHWSTCSAVCALAGSPPRVRGTLSTSAPRLTLRWDHPRVCGEHLISRPPKATPAGSSPRVRGTPRRRCGRCRRPSWR